MYLEFRLTGNFAAEESRLHNHHIKYHSTSAESFTLSPYARKQRFTLILGKPTPTSDGPATNFRRQNGDNKIDN